MNNLKEISSGDEVLEKLWLPIKDEKAIAKTFKGMSSKKVESMAKTLVLTRGQDEPDKRGRAEQNILTNVIETLGESKFQRAYDWIKPLIGEMPYGWWLSGPVPNGQPAYALNDKLENRDFYKKRGIFCAGVANLYLRSVGKKVPTYGNVNFDGGTYAYSIYFRDYIRPFRLSDVSPGDLIGRYFRFNSPDQGHVAIVISWDGEKRVLQSYDGGWKMEGGFNGPGLNQIFTPRESHLGDYYEWRVPAEDWINYEGDFGGFKAVA